MPPSLKVCASLCALAWKRGHAAPHLRDITSTIANRVPLDEANGCGPKSEEWICGGFRCFLLLISRLADWKYRQSQNTKQRGAPIALLRTVAWMVEKQNR